MVRQKDYDIVLDEDITETFVRAQTIAGEEEDAAVRGVGIVLG